MIITDKLKQLIFKRLYKELGKVEMIPYNGSIWFINREQQNWYFEFEQGNLLWWRFDFFPSFFSVFSLEREDYEPILASWVEEVLNHKVVTTSLPHLRTSLRVEEVLNYKVDTTKPKQLLHPYGVEEVLNQ